MSGMTGEKRKEKKKLSFKDILHVFTHNLNTLLVKDEKRKGEGKRTEDVNGGSAGDAKAGKTFWDQIRKRKKKLYVLRRKKEI